MGEYVKGEVVTEELNKGDIIIRGIGMYTWGGGGGGGGELAP